jgi:hypothetical protein
MRNQLIGMAGVYYVAAELCRRGYLALPTTRNLRAFDLVVMNQETGKSIGIEVKTREPKKGESRIQFTVIQATGESILYGDALEKRIKSHYVFVCLPPRGHPKFFIVPKNDVKRLTKESIECYFEMRKHPRKPKEQVLKSSAPVGPYLKQLEKYQDKWELLELK